MSIAVATSLEYLVRELGDPQTRIYERLYRQHPEVQALFVLDADGGVRGSMLQTTLETILDYSAKGRLDHVSLGAWRSHHLAYEVDAELFTRFFLSSFAIAPKTRWAVIGARKWSLPGKIYCYRCGLQRRPSTVNLR